MTKRQYVPRNEIERLAHERGLTASELAQIAGLHRNTVNALFSKGAADNVKLGTLRKVARALGLKLKVDFEPNGHPPESEATK